MSDPDSRKDDPVGRKAALLAFERSQRGRPDLFFEYVGPREKGHLIKDSQGRLWASKIVHFPAKVSVGKLVSIPHLVPVYGPVKREEDLLW
jgi:hypothetical protein